MWKEGAVIPWASFLYWDAIMKTLWVSFLILSSKNLEIILSKYKEGKGYLPGQWDYQTNSALINGYVDQTVLLLHKTSQWGGASEPGSSGHPTLQDGDAVQSVGDGGWGGGVSFWIDNTPVSTSFAATWLSSICHLEGVTCVAITETVLPRGALILSQVNNVTPSIQLGRLCTSHQGCGPSCP